MVGAVAGLARGMTMSVRLEGSMLVTKGSWKTVLSWLGLIVVRIAMAGGAALLGIHEGTGTIFFCVAATFAAQNLLLAYRAGVLGGLKTA
ncbi:hypothetical protein [Fodinicola feengrottensis]|uniref:hypothetical protein n=1 Tax=Fodinicola feengrottensis TaxID=435914 RepID=UPI0013D532FF|nr:hypothetical protein [Fodinicola feengrottensis]